MPFKLTRGSLQLSINAIVVLILAITILGLGLGFIKSQFGGITKQFEGVSEEIEKELVDKIRTSGELLTFNKINLEAVRGVENKFYMGISNTDTTTRCFHVLFKCIKPLSSGGACDTSAAEDVEVGGTYPSGYPVPAGDADPDWFKVFTNVNIEGTEVAVYPVYLQIAGAGADTYLMEVLAFKTSAGDCASPTWDTTPFQKKQFYIRIK